MNRYQIGIVGATGMVGQRLAVLLENHPWFSVAAVAASPRSAGKTYEEAVSGRWLMTTPIPSSMKNLILKDASAIDQMAGLDFVFCAVDMDKAATRALEEAYAKAEIPVISNNSANRGVSDVPTLIPEINDNHLSVIKNQQKRLGCSHGFIVTKPNCSIQSYVPPMTPLLPYGVTELLASTYQAISGAGKNFETWPEMVDNVIPYIGGEEAKSEQEPLKIWGSIQDGQILPKDDIRITTQCIRVPVTDGHLATVFFNLRRKLPIDEIISLWEGYEGRPQKLKLPSAPEKFLTYYRDDNRPQTGLDRDLYGGMGISMGRLRPDLLFDYKFVGLSHNTLRGAAGGGVLTAELLAADGYFNR